MLRTGLVVVASLLATACGAVAADKDAAPSGPDASGGDASVNPNEDLATVTVYDEGGNASSGVDVVFQTGEGLVVQKLATNADGEATSLVHPGDQISVVRTTFGGTRQVITFTGVKPGDHLHSGDPRDRNTQVQPYGSLNFFVIPVPNAASYSVATGCDDFVSTDAQGLAIIQLYDYCHDPSGNVPILATGFDGQGTMVTYAVRPMVPSGGAGTFTMDASEWRSDFASTAMSIIHTPVNTTGSLPNAQLYLLQAPGRELFQYYSTVVGNPQPGDSVNGTVTYPKGLGTSEIHLAEQYGGLDRISTYQLLAVRQRGAPPASVTLDAAQFLPRIASREVVGTGDATRPQLSWTTEAALTVDGGVVHVGWFPNKSFQEWILIVPPGATSVRLPALPASLAAWAPTPDDSLSSPDIALIESTGISGYDGFRGVIGYMPYSYARSAMRLFSGDEEATLRVTATE